MARDITSGFLSEIEASELSPIILIKAKFDSGDANMWTGYGTIVFNGDTYYGGGDLLAIESIEETNEIRATGTRFRLSAIPSATLSNALSEDYQGRPVYCWFGCLSAGAIVSSPYLMFKGKMDIMEISDDGATAEVTLSAESDLVDLRTIREKNYTDEDQKALFPNDRGLEFVSKIQDIQITWGIGV